MSTFTPARPAIAVRWISPLVEPPIACSTISALRTELAVISALGVGAPDSRHFGGALAARLGDAATVGMGRRGGRAHRQRDAQSLDNAGHRAGRAHDHAGADRGGEAAADRSRFRLRRCCRRDALPRSGGNRCRRREPRPCDGRPPSARLARRWSADRRWPRAITCAGNVLSQPPITTTASIGCARIISSVSIAIRLRRNIEVGCAKLS